MFISELMEAFFRCMSALEQNDRARKSWGPEIAFYLQLAVLIWLRIAFLCLRSMVLLAGEGEFLGSTIEIVPTESSSNTDATGGF